MPAMFSVYAVVDCCGRPHGRVAFFDADVCYFDVEAVMLSYSERNEYCGDCGDRVFIVVEL